MGVAAAVLLIALLAAAPVGHAADGLVFTVITTDDAEDGTCDVTHCSLREAINAANAGAGTDQIAFDIPGPAPHTIQPTSALPEITDPVIIDGTTEPDFAGTPIVELDGTSTSGDTLRLTAGHSTVRGLVINRYPGDCLSISTQGNNRIEDNYIGTDVTSAVVAILSPAAFAWPVFVISCVTPSARRDDLFVLCHVRYSYFKVLNLG